MRTLTVIIIIAIMAFAHVASAFNVELTNPTDKLIVYQLIWLECDWEGFPKIKVMATGEIQPGQKVETAANWEPGRWAITWSTKITQLIMIPSRKGVLIASPDKPLVFIPN